MLAAARSDSFVSMCAFIAIRQSQESDAVVRELLLHCFALLPDEMFRNAASFQEAIRSAYQLELPISRVQSALDRLVNTGEVQRPATGDLRLTPHASSRIGEHVEAAASLEARVRDAWLSRCSELHSALDPTSAWEALTRVLYQMFRMHGLQTLGLLGSSVEPVSDDDRSPRAIIRAVVADLGEGEEHSQALDESILEFLAGAGSDTDRVRYLSQLADCTVSYLALTVPPDVAGQLREGLKDLDLFLDTNVLFDIIGLGDEALAHVAQDLARAVTEHQLPLSLRCHEATERELLSTFDGLATGLRATTWTPGMSAAAARAPYINSITRRYHERNAESPISPDSFLQPYEHLDIVIREKGVAIYRDQNPSPPQTVYDLQHDFEAFLTTRKRERTYEATVHDMTVLQCVRRLRSTARSSLEARALFVTNDVMLHVFDKKRSNGQPCTILPRHLIQLLRPFVPATEDFDRAFAAAFAVPEFRSLNARAAAATAKMLEILATYQDFNEKTATDLLANDLLLGKLQSATDKAEMHQLVESAIAELNTSLVVERDALAARLERAERERERDIEAAAAALAADHDRVQNELTGLNSRLEERAQALENALEQEHRARQAAEQRAETTGASLSDVQRRLAAIEDAAAMAESRRTMRDFVVRNVIMAGVFALLIGGAGAWGAYAATSELGVPIRRLIAAGTGLSMLLAFLAWVHARGRAVQSVAEHSLFRKFSAVHMWLYAVLITGILINFVSDRIKAATVPSEESRPGAPAVQPPRAATRGGDTPAPATPTDGTALTPEDPTP